MRSIEAEKPVRLVGADRPLVTQASLPGVDVAMRAPEESRRQVELGQWFSPPWLAAEIVATLDVAGLVVLEPSAGDGAIVQAALAANAACVIAVELDPAMAAKLRARFALEIATGRVEVLCGDFLALEGLPRFDVIAGNVPYDDGVDGDHLSRIADLIVGTERCASILLRTVALHSGDRFERVWSRLAVTRLRACADRIPFPPAGNTAHLEAGKIDVSIFEMVDRATLPATYIQPITWIRRSE